MSIGRDKEDRAGGAARDQAICELEREGKGGALLPDIEGGDAADAEFFGHKRARARKEVLRRHRREEDKIDLFGRYPCVFNGLLCRLRAELADAFAILCEMPLVDPCALADPFIRGVHHAREVRVGNWLSWQISAGPDDR